MRISPSPNASRTRRLWVTPRPTRPSTSRAIDTAHKLSILATLCFGYEIAPDKIHVEGISKITQADIKVAADLGYKIKLLGIAQRSEDGIEQRVHPTFVPKGSAIAGVDGVMNAVALETDHVHELLLAGPGAGGPPTASSVLSDILDIARGTRVPPLGVPSDELLPYRQAPMRAHEGGYYIRFNAKDVPGRPGGHRHPHGRALHLHRQRHTAVRSAR